MEFDYSPDPFEGLIEEIFRFFEGKYLFRKFITPFLGALVLLNLGNNL